MAENAFSNASAPQMLDIIYPNNMNNKQISLHLLEQRSLLKIFELCAPLLMCLCVQPTSTGGIYASQFNLIENVWLLIFNIDDDDWALFAFGILLINYKLLCNFPQHRAKYCELHDLALVAGCMYVHSFILNIACLKSISMNPAHKMLYHKYLSLLNAGIHAGFGF